MKNRYKYTKIGKKWQIKANIGHIRGILKGLFILTGIYFNVILVNMFYSNGCKTKINFYKG